MMETVRGTWTDERLDDLNGKVGSLRTEMRDEFGSSRTEMRDEFRSVRIEMNARFDAMQRTMIQVGGGMIAALIGLIATQL